MLNDAHTTSLYNSITSSIIFPIAQTKISGDIGVINTINRMRNKNSVALLFRGYSFLNNVGTSLSFVAPQNFMPWRKSTRFVFVYSPAILARLFCTASP
ncbi:hypothetical protein (endogenous virus) [Enterobacteria phage VT2phi_272]|uniref:Uncharacterized protein n=1 Tax=Enterobacteria phage VT2phi_272 TaxID=936054 RepID=E7DYR9_9CAUD|nr:hypothetical protein [Enterobacteria phage VT2phi_272]ACT73063.1 hypothetical protein ECSP_3287 [Escherichia coli O157:H7 str. TW14359]ADU03689.1 conserved hypothetical protein [Enterobacteria phage VT2phi_272]WBL49734.1 hypothetical protein [Escherichia phage 06-3462]